MPRIFGQEIQGKTLWIILGVIAAGVAVVVYVRSRGSVDTGGAVPQAPPDEGVGGGGGGGIPVAAPSADAGDNYNTALKQVQLDAAKFGLDQERMEAVERQRQYDLSAELQKGYNNLQLALFGQQQQVGESQARYASEYYRTAEAAQDVITRSVQGKKQVECPPGQHLVVTPKGGASCQAKGGGGFSFKTVFTGAGDVLRGIFQGAAAAAPGIGYGAAQYGAAQAGVLPGGRPVAPRQAPSGTAGPGYTPAISPVPTGQMWA